MSDKRRSYTESHAQLPSIERWLTIEPLLDAALDMPSNERAAWLDNACAGDLVLRNEVERMLTSCTQLSAITENLEQPAVERFAHLWDERIDETRFVAAIADRFEVGREAGRGGMAVVYRARDLGGGRDNRTVALKALRASASAAGSVRFVREIELATRLAHPNIISPFESGMCDGRLWYAMPFVEGESLREYLLREKRLSTAEAVRILREITNALICAHDNGVVHRDLKPGNILLAQHQVLVADFGVAKALDVTAFASNDTREGNQSTTATGIRVGTPGYMAPEQVAGERNIDHRADLYSLGVIAYEMLIGAPPFAASSLQALFTAQLSTRAKRVAKLRRDIPRALDVLVDQLLETEVVNRPTSAHHVSSALERIQRLS